jgi:hypothetical protein
MNYQEPVNISYDIPEDADSVGAVQDDNRAFIFGFKTKREVFAQLGYIMVPNDDQNLASCAKAICDILRMTAILKAMTVSQEALLAELSEENRSAPTAERNAAIVLTAVHQAVINYANSRDK